MDSTSTHSVTCSLCLIDRKQNNDINSQKLQWEKQDNKKDQYNWTACISNRCNLQTVFFTIYLPYYYQCENSSLVFRNIFIFYLFQSCFSLFFSFNIPSPNESNKSIYCCTNLNKIRKRKRKNERLCKMILTTFQNLHLSVNGALIKLKFLERKFHFLNFAFKPPLHTKNHGKHLQPYINLDITYHWCTKTDVNWLLLRWDQLIVRCSGLSARLVTQKYHLQNTYLTF